ncbi:hypothetical protein [Meridianimarinicoccus aquatilis]|uniref:hypothetical protein n=1 Tax=Meridianimarinicoccus aquatilis TaxID=2552766 RepID=UPI0013E0858D|nr:hypothetical protein [Fluviibacterium aquatile]QIE40497.1 hypothetical protein G5B39_00780 [Rhodobacteraceae bacterium SC52]
MFPITFYALLCGLVGLFSPRFGRWYGRLMFGAVLGVFAATAMPHVRALAGL